MATLEDFFHLALALGIGLLIGLERGWQERDAPEGSRVAGFRTIALIALMGGVLGLMANQFGAAVLTGGFLAITVLLGIGYYRDLQKSNNVSATTFIAALLAAGLGALATMGYPRLGVSAAVVTTLILVLKPSMHGLLRHIDTEELKAALRFLLISVVILPLLPNQGYGPYEALNPYVLWWMVVLVSGISFAGYVAVRLYGEKRGLLLTAAIGALASSTAITLAFARRAKVQKRGYDMLAAGIIVASTIMFARIAIVASVIAPVLLLDVLFLTVPMGLAGIVSCVMLTPKKQDGEAPEFKLDNPFDLRIALLFGLLLGAILVGARFLQDQFGSSGVYAIAAITGLFDVDAMTVSAGQMTYGGLDPRTAAIAAVVAGLSNTVAKAILAIAIGGTSMLRPIGLSFGSMTLAGVAAIIALRLV